MNENYIKYLNFLDEKLGKFFKSQEPFIFCKKGCNLCCKNGEFPYSVTEFIYLLEGIESLEDDVLVKIAENIKKIKQEKETFKGKRFVYDCPFLINKECSLYKYRGVICRAFGLITDKNKETTGIPFCSFLGLNYSNVLSDDMKSFSDKKLKKLNTKAKPLVFNTDYKFLTNKDFEEKFNFKFGEKRPLIDWFIKE